MVDSAVRGNAAQMEHDTIGVLVVVLRMVQRAEIGFYKSDPLEIVFNNIAQAQQIVVELVAPGSASQAEHGLINEKYST